MDCWRTTNFVNDFRYILFSFFFLQSFMALLKNWNTSISIDFREPFLCCYYYYYFDAELLIIWSIIIERYTNHHQNTNWIFKVNLANYFRTNANQSNQTNGEIGFLLHRLSFFFSLSCTYTHTYVKATCVLLFITPR